MNNYKTNYNQCIRIDLCNVRSICNKIDLVKDYILSNDVEFLFLTETWLSNKVKDPALCPKDYNIIRCDRTHTTGGGVLLLYKSIFDVVEISHSNNNDPFEYICVDIYDGKKPFRVICFYIPPTCSNTPQVIENVCNIINLYASSSKPIFIIGDFNMPTIDWISLTPTSNLSHSIFLDYCIDHCFSQHVHSSTHNKGNILDLLLCNPISKNLLLSCSVLPPLSASCDHSIISFKLITKNTPAIPVTSSYPDFKNANYDLINEELSKFLTNWKSSFNFYSPLQETYDHFISFLNSLIDKYVPTKAFTKKKHKMPTHINKLLKKKLLYYRKFKKDKNFYSSYKEISKTYDLAVQKWHNDKESNICKNPSSKKFYGYFNKNMKSKNFIPPLYDDNNNIHLSNTDKAELLNSYFHKVFTQDDGKVLHTLPKTNTFMDNFTIEESDIINAIAAMKDKITRTPEGIPSYFIKRTALNFIPFLCYFYNASLYFNSIPNQWKKAIIIPIHKRNNKNRAKNYRPISLTSSFARIMEAIINKKNVKLSSYK